jgi:DNA-directed RNA polymerase specialized sigma24 family protein
VRVSRNLCIDEHRSRAREKAALVADELIGRTEDTGSPPDLEEKN